KAADCLVGLLFPIIDMTHNIFLYDFNGSVRRNRLQDAIFKDMGQKEEFMRRLEDERNERHLLTKKKAAATKIQAVYRSYRIRKRFHAFLRENFDGSGHATTFEQLKAQIGRLSFFFRPNIDLNRTVMLCADAVSLSQHHDTMAFDHLKCKKMLTLAINILPYISRDGNYVPVLRCIQVYLPNESSSSSWLRNYYHSIITLFINQFDLSQPLRIEEWLPPRADTILRFLILPANRSTNRHLAIEMLLVTLMERPFEKYVVCVITPFICQLIHKGELNLSEIIHSLREGAISTIIDMKQAPLFTHLLAMIVSVSPLESLPLNEKLLLPGYFADLVEHVSRPVTEQRRRSLNSDSDTDDENVESAISTNVGGAPLATIGYYVETATAVLTDCALRKWFVVSAISSEGGVRALSSLCYFLRQNAPEAFLTLLCSLLAYKEFMPRLWQYIVSLNIRAGFGATRSLISVLEQGEYISDSDQNALIPPLSLFIALLSNILRTIDDDDLTNGGQSSTILPFTLAQIASIATHFRDLTLGLIDVAYPVNVSAFPTNVTESPDKRSKWADLFKNVASITKVLYERDSRLHFMSNGFWSSHNRQVVMNTSLWRTGKGRRRTRERPFQFVRLLLRENEDNANEEPPTAAELRNISILQSIPFVIPFMHRVQMFTELINQDRRQSGTDSDVHDAYHFVVHRSTLYEDAFWNLSPSKVPDMRRPIRVQMVNWVGLDEAGIDGGGIFREFLAELAQTALDPSRGFFATTHDHLLYPNPLAQFLYPSNFQDHFYFIGRIIAKLIYEGQLAETRFADFFLAQWLGSSGDSVLDLEYVKSYDPLVYNNLKFLKCCPREEVDALELDFSVIIDNLGATEFLEGRFEEEWKRS
uniref:HECT-type E3 ubiquitin transferase n=2 Tax=Parascaris univalens TaxID=6257 RepID=A0A915BTW7_PARUN